MSFLRLHAGGGGAEPDRPLAAFLLSLYPMSVNETLPSDWNMTMPLRQLTKHVGEAAEFHGAETPSLSLLR